MCVLPAQEGCRNHRQRIVSADGSRGPYADPMLALLAVRFLAELGMLVCLGVGGWQRGGTLLGSAVLGVVLPIVAAGSWARWIAPRAPRRLRDPARLGVEVMLFAAALLLVMGAEPSPAMTVVGLVVGAAFLISIPARGHEPVPSGE